MSDYALSFKTDLAPAEKILVDGVEYELLGADHLSEADTAELTALFARFGVLTTELANTSNVAAGTALATKVAKTRIQILLKVTSLPQDVAEKLHISQQGEIIEHVIEQIEAEGGSEG